MFIYLIFTFFTTSAFAAIIQKVQVQATPNYVGSLTSAYDFTIENIPTTIPTNGILTLTFPNTFVVPDDLQIFAFQGLSVNSFLTVQGNTVTIMSGAPYTSAKIFFRISQQGKTGIIPLTNETGFIQVYTRYANNTIIDYNDTVSVAIVPGPVQNLTLQSYNSFTSAMSSLIIRLTVSNITALDSVLAVKFPTINPQAPSELQRSSLSSPRFCIKRSSTGDQWLPFEVKNDYLLIKEAFQAPLELESNITIEISDITNPYSLSPLGFFEVNMQSSLGGFISETKQGQLTVTRASRPRLVEVESSDLNIGKATNFTVKIRPLGFFNANDSIEVGFPSMLGLSQYNETLLVERESGMLKEGLVYRIENNTVIVEEAVGQYTEEEVSLKIVGVENVGYFTEDSTFEVRVRDENGMLVVEQTQDIPYRTVAGSVDVEEFSVSDRRMRVKADYVFEFTVSTAIDEGEVEVIFPDNYTEFSDEVTCSIFGELNSTANCTIANRTVRITNVFPLSNQSTVIQLTVHNVTNPRSTVSQTTGSFLIQTINNGNIIDATKEDLTINLIPSVLNVQSAEALSSTANASPSILSVTLSAEDPIPSGSTIEFQFSNETILLLEQLNCSMLPPHSTNIMCIPNSQNLILVNAFPTENIPSESELNITISGLSNLRPVEPGCLFNIVIRSPDGFIVALTGTPVSFRTPQPLTIGKVDFIPLTSTPDATTDYIVKFKAPFDLQADDQVSIVFPSGFTSTSRRVLIELINSTYTTTLNQSYTSSESVELALEEITNPVEPTNENFRMLLLSADGDVMAQEGFQTTETTSQTSGLENFEVTLAVTRVGEIGALTVKFKNTETITQEDRLQFELPKSFKVMSSRCEPSFGATCEVNANNIVFIAGLETTLEAGNYTITFLEVRNKLDSTPTSDVFSLNVIDQDNETLFFESYLLDQQATCVQGCARCKNSYDQCWQCSQNWLLLASSCVTECPAGYFINNGACVLCDLDNCLVCQTQDICLTCTDSFTPVSGTCQKKASPVDFIISCWFVFAVAFAIMLKFLPTNSKFLTTFLSLLSVVYPAILIWATVRLGINGQTLPLVFFIVFLVLMLIGQVITIKITRDQPGISLSKREKFSYFLMKWCNFKCSLPLLWRLDSLKSVKDVDFKGLGWLIYVKLLMNYDNILIPMIFAVSVYSAVDANQMHDKSTMQFFIQVSYYTGIIYLLESYLAFRFKKKAKENLKEQLYQESEGNESTLRKLKPLDHSSRDKEKSQLEYSVSNPETTRIKLNGQKELTINEISFMDKNFGGETSKALIRSPVEQKKVKQPMFFFSDAPKKTTNEGNVMENISYFSEDREPEMEDRDL